MLVSDMINYALRISGVLGVGQTALPQDTADAALTLEMMLQQWRQKRWLVFRLDWTIIPLVIGKQSYTVAAVAPADIVTGGFERASNIQSCFLRQEVGGAPNTFPIDFPMRILGSRQEYDAISLKFLQSWPAAIYYDPVITTGILYIWPIPVQHNFSLYVAWPFAIDRVAESGDPDLDSFLPVEAGEAIAYNLALRLMVNYKMPMDQGLAAAAKASLNTLRQTNFALQPLGMPQSLRPGTRLKNPMGGFYPEISAGVAVTTLG